MEKNRVKTLRKFREGVLFVYVKTPFAKPTQMNWEEFNKKFSPTTKANYFQEKEK
jgi:hypothetical protein